MSDNTVANAGSGGVTFATDEIAGVMFQRVKLVHGVDGTNDGDVATTNPLPITAATLPLPTGAAKEAGGNLATLVAKDFSTETTLAALKALINLAQGASSASLTGPMVQGLVSDGPESYLDNTLRPFSMTNEGRLRVSTVAAFDHVTFFSDDIPDATGDPSYIASPWASSIW